MSKTSFSVDFVNAIELLDTKWSRPVLVTPNKSPAKTNQNVSLMMFSKSFIFTVVKTCHCLAMCYSSSQNHVF